MSNLFAKMLFPWICFLFTSASTFSQPNLPEKLRGVVYRIEQPSLKIGTATIFKTNTFPFLITNRHVLEDSNKKICDSIFVFQNTYADNMEVLSGPKFMTVYLQRNDSIFFHESEVKGVDLVLISLGLENVRNDFEINHLTSDYIPTLKTLNFLIDTNFVLTAIGYPSKRLPTGNGLVYPEYRWGKFKKMNAGFIEMTIPVQHGSSGSPVFMERAGNYYFIGIVTKKNETKNLCYALPSSSILECFSGFLNYVKQNK